MPGCGKQFQISKPPHHMKMIDWTCGQTGYYGVPEFCSDCAPKYAGRDWRREAEEAGEQFDPD